MKRFRKVFCYYESNGSLSSKIFSIVSVKSESSLESPPRPVCLKDHSLEIPDFSGGGGIELLSSKMFSIVSVKSASSLESPPSPVCLKVHSLEIPNFSGVGGIEARAKSSTKMFPDVARIGGAGAVTCLAGGACVGSSLEVGADGE